MKLIGICTIVGIPMDRVLTIKMSDFRTQGILKYLEDKGGSLRMYRTEKDNHWWIDLEAPTASTR